MNNKNVHPFGDSQTITQNVNLRRKQAQLTQTDIREREKNRTSRPKGREKLQYLKKHKFRSSNAVRKRATLHVTRKLIH